MEKVGATFWICTTDLRPRHLALLRDSYQLIFTAAAYNQIETHHLMIQIGSIYQVFRFLSMLLHCAEKNE